MAETKCRHFTGYKPCGLSTDCTSSCHKRDLIQNTVLIVHLGALGAVVRSTALLKAIHRKYKGAQVTWVTDKPADQILKNHPLIDRVLTTTSEDILKLSALHFDVALVIDKSLKASGVLKQTSAKEVFGFTVQQANGAILPATPAAEELWQLGLDDHAKFYVNQKSEIQLATEALELDYQRDDYFLPLTLNEEILRDERSLSWSLDPNTPIVGLNTGCSGVIPFKKWTVEYHREVIESLLAAGYKNIVLLGGPEDAERNQKIAEGLPVQSSPTNLGLRDGLVSVAACDVVLSGDSLGMHMAISQQKYVIAWFGPTCAHEIDLYDRGEKLLAQVGCAPCWKRLCNKEQMCYDHVPMAQVMLAVRKGLNFWQKRFSSYKQPFSEISS